MFYFYSQYFVCLFKENYTDIKDQSYFVNFSYKELRNFIFSFEAHLELFFSVWYEVKFSCML